MFKFYFCYWELSFLAILFDLLTCSFLPVSFYFLLFHHFIFMLYLIVSFLEICGIQNRCILNFSLLFLFLFLVINLFQKYGFTLYLEVRVLPFLFLLQDLFIGPILVVYLCVSFCYLDRFSFYLLIVQSCGAETSLQILS